MQYYKGDSKKYFYVVNSSSYEERVSISIESLRAEKQHIWEISEVSAASWLHASSMNMTIPPHTKKYFYVEATPYPFLKNPEYYARVVIEDFYGKQHFPLIVRIKETKIDRPTIRLKKTYLPEKVLFSYSNDTDIHQIVDTKIIIKENNRYKIDRILRDNKLLLPKETIKDQFLTKNYDNKQVWYQIIVNKENKKTMRLK